MFRYRLHHQDGSEAGEAAYGHYVQPGETIFVSDGETIRGLRVLQLVTIEERWSDYAGLLMVEETTR
jgi:hypothetical protein